MREAYEKAYEIIMPILSKEENNNRLSANVMMLDLMNEFINKDALFDTYRGSVFGSFNGVKKIKTKIINLALQIYFFYIERDNTYTFFEVLLL
jgi:tyrosine-protein phosphatase YwqE